jgi:parvulin-like peptidyl-prolyl isomerase
LKDLMQHRRPSSRLARFASLLAVGCVVALVPAALSAQIIEQVLVKVNGEIITKTELEQRQVQALRQRGIQPADDEALKKAIADITPSLIVETIDEMLLVQRGKELGYTMTDEDFNRVVTRIRTDNKLDTDEAFEAALKQEGLTMAELRTSLEKQMMVTRVQQAEVMGKINITEEEARKYHAEHVGEFTKSGQVTIREILVAVPKSEKGVNVGIEEEAKAKAEAARKRVLDGEAFEQVAGEVSTSASRANGGLVGPLNPAELTPSFQELLKGMKPGDVSEVVRTTGGYQIVKLETKTDDEVLAPEQARDRIADVIFEQKRQVEFKKYLEKLRAQAIIEWKNEEIKKAWQSRVELPPAAAPAAPAAPEKPPTN